MRTLFFFVLIAVWLYFIVEAAMTKHPSMLPRYAWVLLTIFLPGIGTLLWFVFGRRRSARGRGRAPDDDPRFLRSLDDEVWRKRLRDWRNRNEGKS